MWPWRAPVRSRSLTPLAKGPQQELGGQRELTSRSPLGKLGALAVSRGDGSEVSIRPYLLLARSEPSKAFSTHSLIRLEGCRNRESLGSSKNVSGPFRGPSKLIENRGFERVGGPTAGGHCVLPGCARRLAQWVSNTDSERMTRQGQHRSFRAVQAFLTMESLILAQDERWRRA